MSPPIFLNIGASGRSGVALTRACAAHPQKPPIHTFCRTPSKLSSNDAALCASIQMGDATSAQDVEAALRATKADIVLVSVGVANTAKKSDIREQSARALQQVLVEEEFQHVRVVVVGAVGAGGSKLAYGWGIGALAKWMMKHVIEDHNRQEDILGALGERCWIVRTMGLSEGEEGGRGITEFEDRAKRLMLYRKDLAEWMVEEILLGKRWGHHVNVTSEKGGKTSEVVKQIFTALRTR